MKLRSLVTALFMLAIAHSGAARADEPPIEVQLVDAFNKAFGKHPGFRANHAKGIVAEGTFGPPRTRQRERAAVFSGVTVPVTVRFSDATGFPTSPTVPRRQPARHGDQVPSAGRQRHRHGDQLAEVLPRRHRRGVPRLSWRRRQPARRAKPTKLDAVRGRHPAVPAACATVATPDSFADEEYFGIDAFVSSTRPASARPCATGDAGRIWCTSTPADAAKRAPDFLSTSSRSA